MRTAFKEWAVIVDALGRGEQIVILRKGGLHESSAGFSMEYQEFLLFPTLFHQQAESVWPNAAARLDEILARQDPSQVRFEYFARVVRSARLRSLADSQRLRGQHAWKDEVIASRFKWGGEKSIHAVACRVFRLNRPISAPNLTAYGGCKSWVALEVEIDTSEAAPVLDEAAFAAKFGTFDSATKTRTPA